MDRPDRPDSPDSARTLRTLRALAARPPRKTARNAPPEPLQDSPRRQALAWLVMAGLLAIFWAVFSDGNSYLREYTHDVFILFDGMHRLASGQVPHLDFSTPLGVLGYLIPQAGYWWTGSYAGALEAAGTMLATALLPVATAMALRRVSVWMAVALVLAVGCMFAVPLNLGEDGNATTTAMFYNRWAWAMWLMLGLALVPARRETATGTVTLGLVVALLLLALAFLKASFLAVALGVPALMLIHPGARRRAALIGLAGLGLGIGAVALAVPGLLPAYMADLAMAMKASSLIRGRWDFLVVDNLKDIVLATAAFAAAARAGAIGRRDWPVLPYVIVAGILAQVQNFQNIPLPILLLAFALTDRALNGPIAGRPLRGGPLRGGPIAGAGALRLAILGMALAFLAPLYLDWIKATLRHVQAPAADDTLPVDLPGMEGVRIFRGDRNKLTEGLARDWRSTAEVLADPEAPHDPPGIRNGVEYVETLRDGLALLARNGITRGTPATVQVLDFTNPFAAMLDLPRRKGGYSWMHAGRNFSEKAHLPPEDFLAGVVYVMEPRLTTYSRGLAVLQRVYGPALLEHFQQIDRSQMWVLYRRKNGADAADG